MPYCPNCSAELERGARGCPDCGAERSGPGGWHPIGKPLGSFAEPPPDPPAPSAVDMEPIPENTLPFRLILRSFVGLLALAPLLLIFDYGLSLPQRLLAAGALAAALFIVVFVHRFYEICLGLCFSIPGLLLAWSSLLGPERLPLVPALLALAATAAMTVLVPAMLQPKRVIAIPAILLFVLVGVSLIAYLSELERTEVLVGLTLCGLGVVSFYAAWASAPAR